MVYHGQVRDGRIEVNDGTLLPEGAEVEVRVLRIASPKPASPVHTLEENPIETQIMQIVADVPPSVWEKLPADLSDQLDHYIYGLPRR